MCFDAWEEPIHEFAELYLDAVDESKNPNRTPQHRRQWEGKAEFFSLAYPDKLMELDNEDLDDWLDTIEETYKGERLARLLEPAEAELKRRREEGSNEPHSSESSDSRDDGRVGQGVAA